MLDVSQVSFAYHAGRPDAIPALHQVSLQIAPGELVAVIGRNGSGKSTLAKLLCAILEPTSGSITVDGIAATPRNVWEIRRRVGMVFQRPDDQLVASTVVDEVAFGPENLGLPREEIERRVREALAALDLGGLAQAQVRDLSGGEKQRLAVAGVLAMRPSYLVLDEPTTMVAPKVARQVLALAHDLRDRLGVAVVHITHFMREAVGFDRVVVMDGGRVVMDSPPREVFGREEALMAAGLAVPRVTRLARRLRDQGLPLRETVLTPEELAGALRDVALSRGGRPGAGTPPDPAQADGTQAVGTTADARARVIEVRDLHFTYMAGTPLSQDALRGASMSLAEGETVALLGGAHAGKSTLVEFLNGLRIPPPGHVFFEGRDVAARDFDRARMRDAVGVVFQQPETQIFEETVGKDVSYVPRRKKLPPAESRAIVERSLTDVGLDYEAFRLRYVHALSGGQKRRVALAGVLAAEPRVLVLDEPAAGLDPRGRAELAALIRDLTRRRGLTVVLVGAAIDELAELADRAIVMHEGRVALEGPLAELLRRPEELRSLGLELSEAAEIALALRGAGLRVPDTVRTLEELEHVLIAWQLSSHAT